MKNENGHIKCPSKLYPDWRQTADFWYDKAYHRGIELDAALEESARLRRKLESEYAFIDLLWLLIKQ